MKKCMIVLIAFVLLGGLYAGLKANQGEPGTVETQRFTEPDEAWVVTLPRVNVNALLSEDKAQESPLVKFAEAIPVAVDTCNAGKWKPLKKGDRQWEIKIVSQGAFSLQLEFNRFFLPNGTQLAIHDKQGKLLELFTDRDNNAEGSLLSGLLPGDEITVKYLEPENTEEIVDIEIGNVFHGYRDMLTLPVGYEAAGLIIADGVRAGYGVLVNNTTKDFKPYFLTTFDYLDVAAFEKFSPPLGVARLSGLASMRWILPFSTWIFMLQVL